MCVLIFVIKWQIIFCEKLSLETKHDFWLFAKIKSALKGQRFRDIKYIQKWEDDTENYSTTAVPNMFPTVATSLD